jgi:hypothetical protein
LVADTIHPRLARIASDARMIHLQSWNIAELRRLAREFRQRAGETALPHYIELMLFTATQLEAEANRQERSRLGRHLSILV